MYVPRIIKKIKNSNNSLKKPQKTQNHISIRNEELRYIEHRKIPHIPGGRFVFYLFFFGVFFFAEKLQHHM